MTEMQKVIKYVAISFAFFLIFSIFSFTIFVVSSFVTTSQKEETSEITKEYQDDYEKLSIQLNATSLEIKKGDIFKIETNNNRIQIEKQDQQIFIKEKKFVSNKEYHLIIYIPEEYELNEVFIDSDVGTINIDQIITKKLQFNLGAGKVTIQDLEVSEKTKINGGAGSISIQNGLLNNADLDLGIGNLKVTTKLLGNSKIDAGVGNISLNLIGNQEEYQIKLEKGIGNIKINQQEMNNTTYGDGSNMVSIGGGIGNINVNIEE